MECTWKNCDIEATHPQLDKNGKQWANLCVDHHRRLKDCADNFDPKRFLSAWVKAQGGAKAAASRL